MMRTECEARLYGCFEVIQNECPPTCSCTCLIDSVLIGFQNAFDPSSIHFYLRFIFGLNSSSVLVHLRCLDRFRYRLSRGLKPSVKFKLQALVQLTRLFALGLTKHNIIAHCTHKRLIGAHKKEKLSRSQLMYTTHNNPVAAPRIIKKIVGNFIMNATIV